jgi:hypothetical protein
MSSTWVSIVVLLMTVAATEPGCGNRAAGSGSNVQEANDRDRIAKVREADLRMKERCAIAAERFDKLFPPQNFAASRTNETSVSEVFFSPQRNSCVCEVSASGTDKKNGISNLLTLYDCLTREDLGETLLRLNDPEWARLQEAWKRKKDALKGGS